MVHQHIREEKIIDYVLGHLSNKEHFKINAHLAVCEKCTNERNYWEKQLNFETKPIPSPSLKHKVLTEINQKTSLKNRFKNRFAYVALGLCSIFILVIGIQQLATNPTELDHTQQVAVQDDDLINLLRLQSNNLQPMEPITNDQLGLINIHNYDQLNKTHPIDQLTELWKHPNYQSTQQIIFVNNDAICNYEVQNKDITCVRFKINPKTNQLIPVDSTVYKRNRFRNLETP